MKLKTLGAISGLALFAAAFAGSAQAQNIDSTAAANLSFCTIASPGGGATVIGQYFSVPAGQSVVSSFGLEVDAPATMVFRGELYAWDVGTQRATGPALYTSSAISTAGPGVTFLNFVPGAPVPVTAGGNYVVFLSTVRDAGTGNGCMQYTNTNVIPTGQATYKFSASPADFTTGAWSVNGGEDLGIRVNFAPAVITTVPTLSEWAMILFGVMLAGGAAVLVQRRRLNA